MTPDELEKEAERILAPHVLSMDKDDFADFALLKSEIVDALRAVHDAGRAEGFSEAIEKAAGIADDHNGCVDVKCLSESNCGATAANQICALKIGDGK